MLGQHIKGLHEVVDVDSVHVNIPYSSIFLCGGDINSQNGSIKSLRMAFLRFAYDKPFEKHKILIAEEINPFFPRGTYKDLLSLESDLAQIASLILVFSESYGSAAELGAFSMKSEIAARLLVVIDDKNFNDSSFVKLGPLRSLQNNVGRSAVYVLDRSEMNFRSILDVSKIDIKKFKTAMIEAIAEREKSIETSSTYNPSHHGHQIMLMVGIVQQHGALTLFELQNCISLLGFPLQPDQMENLLLCAEFVGWVKKVSRGSFDYYVSPIDKQIISFRRRPDASNIDMVRWRTDVVSYWRDNDSTRFSVISQARSLA
jgi:hypothetical protein